MRLGLVLGGVGQGITQALQQKMMLDQIQEQQAEQDLRDQMKNGPKVGDVIGGKDSLTADQVKQQYGIDPSQIKAGTPFKVPAQQLADQQQPAPASGVPTDNGSSAPAPAAQPVPQAQGVPTQSTPAATLHAYQDAKGNTMYTTSPTLATDADVTSRQVAALKASGLPKYMALGAQLEAASKQNTLADLEINEKKYTQGMMDTYRKLSAGEITPDEAMAAGNKVYNDAHPGMTATTKAVGGGKYVTTITDSQGNVVNQSQPMSLQDKMTAAISLSSPAAFLQHDYQNKMLNIQNKTLDIERMKAGNQASLTQAQIRNLNQEFEKNKTIYNALASNAAILDKGVDESNIDKFKANNRILFQYDPQKYGKPIVTKDAFGNSTVTYAEPGEEIIKQVVPRPPSEADFQLAMKKVVNSGKPMTDADIANLRTTVDAKYNKGAFDKYWMPTIQQQFPNTLPKAPAPATGVPAPQAAPGAPAQQPAPQGTGLRLFGTGSGMVDNYQD